MISSRTIALLFLVAFTLGASTATAQKIRTYGESGGGTATGTTAGGGGGGQGPGYYVPGMPVPQEGQQQAEGGGKEERGGGGGSYVTVFRRQGQTTQQDLAKILNLPLEKLYSGVIPGKRDHVEHLKDAEEKGEAEAKPNQLTWVGFMAKEQSTRVFFQTARRAQYEVGTGEGGNTVTVTFYDTKIPARNFSRFIDASFFNRNVTRIETNKVDRTTVRVTIQLRKYERPSVNREGKYLYLDFSRGVGEEMGSDEST